MDLGDLVRRLKGKSGSVPRPEAPPPLWTKEANSQEARLRVVPSGAKVEFFSLITGQRLFGLPSGITGPPVKSTESADRGRTQVVLTLPLEGGRTVRVTYQSPPEVEPQEVEVTRASQARVPPDSSMVEFLLTREEHEFRYVFEVPDTLDVQDFQAVADQRPVFRSIPPVAQMAAFLRAMTQHKRSAMTCLEDIARQAGSEKAQAEIAAMEFPRNHEFSSPHLQALEQVLKRGGRIIHPAVLAAMAIFADLELGRPPGEPFEVSSAACWHVARHFGVDPSASWEELFGEQPEYPENEALRALLKKSASSRTHLDILSDLGREAKSQRVAAFTEALRGRLEGGQFQVNDEQMALGALLAASGLPVHGNTLTALCLFVDVEVGVLTPLSYEKLASAGDRVDTSMYAMVAVAGAFDLGLRGFALEQATEKGLVSLLQLAGGKLMARFLKPGTEGFWWEYLSSPAEVRQRIGEGLEFTGHVLGRFGVIDQLNERDLGVFLKLGKPLMACFSADYDRTVLWKKLTEPAETYTFIKRFTAFSFSRMVMAELVSGSPGGPAVVGELDQRGNYQYSFQEAPPGECKHVVLPTVEELPELMYELGQDPLLGRSETLLEEARTLELIHASVASILQAPPTYYPLDERPDLLERLHEVARAITAPVIDAPTRDGLFELVKKPGYASLDVFEPLFRAVDTQDELEFLALHLMFALCCAEEVQLERRFKQFDEPRFRQLLRTRLHAFLDSPEVHTRALAVRLLVTQEEIRDRNDRLIAHYELSRARQDENPDVQAAAGQALAQLALEGVVPLPEVIRVKRTSGKLEPIAADPIPAEDQENLEMEAEIREWVSEKAALPESDKRQALATQLAGNDEKIREIASFLVGLNRAISPDRHTYLILLRPDRLRPIRTAVFDSWKVFALTQGQRLAELVNTESALDLRLGYQDFLAERGPELARSLGGEAPFLGASAGPVTLYHLAPSERFGTWRRKDSSFVETRKEDAPLFLALLQRIEEMPRVLRVERAGGLPLVELESHLNSFTTERMIEPWMAEVFQWKRHRFAPFMHRMGLSREQLAREEDFEDFEALLGLLHEVIGGKPTPLQAYPDAQTSVETPAAPVERSGPSFKDIAINIAQSFDLPRSHQKQVINILLDVGIQSVYDL